MKEKKRVTVLGSTGSIGTQALDVAEFSDYIIDALAFGSNIRLGEEQIRKFKPKFVAVNDEKVAGIDVMFAQDLFAGDGVIIKKGKKVFHRAFVK